MCAPPWRADDVDPSDHEHGAAVLSVVRLIGLGIGYSASPAMQSAAFAALGLPHDYVLADVRADELAATVATLRADDSLGANVTTPHKAAVAQLVDELEPLAREIGAVNTVVQRRGRLLGSNTDLPALVDAIRQLRPAVKHAVVLGAGGAGRAVVRALAECGAGRVTVVGRREEPGVTAWSHLAGSLPEADLLINATKVGTGASETPVPAALLHRGLAVLDLVYRPSPTRLVAEARAAGAIAAAGGGVLLGQGWRSLEAWLGVAAPVAIMAAALKAELGEGADV